MRKVRKQDEISIKNVASNIARYKQTSSSSKTIKAFLKLEKDLERMSTKEKSINPEVFMKKIYAFVDFYMEREIHKFTECAKGCAYCCRLPVSTSIIEAYYLYKAASKMDNIEFRNIAHSAPTTSSNNNEYCPFLNQKTATCSAYEHRPLNCRVFVSIDGWKECVEPLNKHYMHNWTSNEMLKHIRENLNTISAQNGNITDADIRDWFTQK